MLSVKARDNPGGGRAFATTVFGASAVAVAAYTALAAVLFVILIWQANRIFVDNVLDSLATEATVFQSVAETAGADIVATSVARLAAGDGGNLYLLLNSKGAYVAGNLRGMPVELADASKSGAVFTYSPLAGDGAGRPDADAGLRYAAGVVLLLADGGRLVVARDIEAQRSMVGWMRGAALVTFLVIGVGGLVVGYLASRATLRRVSQLTAATRSIMSGDLSGRLPLRGNNDEFDQLSMSVNVMLERIEQLMHGLKEVSDNIAHDLKTPVNRLRQRADSALRSAKTEEDLRNSLGETIEAADEIIKTFNALLLIARLEAGAIEETKVKVDLARLVEDAAELYEPVAEEAGASLKTTELDAISLTANRHLVGQAVINLIDNALKYGCTAPATEAASDGASLNGRGHNLTRLPRIEIAVRHRGALAEIVVADNGPGISAADRERAMERFVRLDKSRSSPGTGLGLSLVAAVARLHAGRLRLEDNAPGLRAVLSLPISSVESGQSDVVSA